MPRVSKDPEVRRNEIMDASLQLFSERGFDQTAVSDIVKKIGVAQGTFYYYFKTKNDIMIAIIERSMYEQVKYIQTVSEDEHLTLEQKLDKILFEKPQRTPEYTKVLEFIHHEGNALIHQKFIVRTVRESVPYVTRILEQGTAEGIFEVQSPQETAELILTGLRFMLDPGFFHWSDETYRQKTNTVRSIVARMLGRNFVWPEPDKK